MPGDLLAAARRGEGPAFEQLYGLLAGPVAGYLRAQGVDDVEDLTSEVFLAAFTGLAGFDGPPERFRSWVFTIAHHKAVDETRRRARRPDLVPYRLEADGRTSVSAEQDALAAVGQARLYDLFARLTADQREVLLLRVVADLTVEQVAGQLGKPTGAVKALQRRGLTTLRKILLAEGVPL